MKRLLIAAGGGGDAIAAVMLRAALYGPDAPALVLTYSWERLTVDPLPGPRGRGDFTGLAAPRADLALVTGATAVVAPAGSSLPRIAADLSGDSSGPTGGPGSGPVTEIGLLDPYEGTVGLARTLRAAAAHCGTHRVDVVDVGGDILARGDEPTLRSPLGDALVLAACAQAGLATAVWIAGPGLDRELPEHGLHARLPPAAFGLTAEHVEPVRRLFGWHPSEASAMLAAAARGVRGVCGIRDVPEPLRLDDRSAGVHHLPLDRALALNPLARRLAGCPSLGRAERISLDVCGFSEIARERARAAAAPTPAVATTPTAVPAVPAVPPPELLARHARWQTDLHRRGITLTTRRRTAEELALSPASARHLHDHLATDPAQDAFPLWRVTPTTPAAP
ncbi:DUF1152 domain-containing protein [Kitasatospora sp. NPDC090091]|uniref:DUF1152 domain-containing protein n=1 Tax=Kitasatospora sp. NPDC090091 TaxID=3364081 RepID=UPI00380A10E5